MESPAMVRHPGGAEQTLELLRLSEIVPPCRILDMGAGDGETVCLLEGLGFEASGIDLKPGQRVTEGDLLHCPYPDGAFDVVISECSFFSSGDRPGAFREAARLIPPGGLLLVGDVSFAGDHADEEASAAGVALTARKDATALWREYYLRSVWEGRTEETCSIPRGKCSYYLSVYMKEN